jgi:zinc protease
MKLESLIKTIALSLIIAVTSGNAKAASTVEFEEDFSLPIVYLNIVIDAGAVNDPADRLGLCFISNHMLLRGTQRLNKLQFNESVNKLGAALDVDVRNEGTVLRGAVLAENLEKFLALIEEALVKPKFTAEEIRKLKNETIGQILETKANDRMLVRYNFYRFFYGSHPYGNPVLGTQKTVERITGKDIVDFYSKHLGDKTVHLFGSGAAQSNIVKTWFAGLTDKLSALHPDVQANFQLPKMEIPSGRRTLLVNKPNVTQSQILLGGVGMRPDQPGYYAILLGNNSFGGPTFQATLMREIRVKRGWTYGAYNTFSPGKEPRHYAMYFFPKTGDTVPAIELALNLFENFTKNGVTQPDFNYSQQSMVNNAPFNYDTPRKRLENATAEYLMNFPKNYYKDFAGNIGKVKFEEVLPAVRGFFRPENLTLTLVGDAEKLKAPLATLPGFSQPIVKSYHED